MGESVNYEELKSNIYIYIYIIYKAYINNYIN